MGSAVKNTDRLIAKGSLPSACRMVLLVAFLLMLGAYLHSQCPNNGQTKVIKPNQGTGYYFYRFLGDSSFRYFLDGQTFSFNDKDDPGRTFIFIDDIAYESIVKDRMTSRNTSKAQRPKTFFVQRQNSTKTTSRAPSPRW